MTLTRLFLALAMSAHTALALAQPASQAPLLVDAAWLAEHLNDRNLVVFQVDNAEEYKTGHIPGARYIGLDDISGPGPLRLELPAPADLRARLQSWGVSDDSRIVVYYGKNGVFQSATRMVLTLDYIGLGGQTSLLNGGLAAWTAASRPLTTAAPTITPGTLRDRSTKAVTVDADYVLGIKAKPAHVLIDGRAPVFYNGLNPSFGVHGHIEGAVNIPFTEILDSQLMVDKARLAEIFTKAGVKAGDTVIAYCHLGQQGTAVVFASRLLGHPVMLYDGSINDWSANKRGPLVK